MGLLERQTSWSWWQSSSSEGEKWEYLMVSVTLFRTLSLLRSSLDKLRSSYSNSLWQLLEFSSTSWKLEWPEPSQNRGKQIDRICLFTWNIQNSVILCAMEQRSWHLSSLPCIEISVPSRALLKYVFHLFWNVPRGYAGSSFIDWWMASGLNLSF